MSDLQEWTSTLCADLGLDAAGVDCAQIVDMARHIARTVELPAGPVTAYLIGMAVARGLSPAEAADRLAHRAQRWPRIDWRD
jgi:hypothetical protein